MMMWRETKHIRQSLSKRYMVRNFRNVTAGIMIFYLLCQSLFYQPVTAINEKNTKETGDGIVERWAVIFDINDPPFLATQNCLIAHGWKRDHIKIIGGVTYSELKSAIEWLSQMDDEDDIILLCSNTHGFKGGIALEDRALYYSELGEWIDKCDAHAIIYTISACHSGSAIPVLGKEGRIIMSACRSDEAGLTGWLLAFLYNRGDVTSYYGYHGGPNPNGAFWRKDCDLNEDGWVSAEEAFPYTCYWVEKFHNEFFNPDHPIHPQIYDGIDGELHISLLRKYNNPPDKPLIKGPIVGYSFINYSFSVCGNDSDGDRVLYIIDWGDGDTTGWKGTFSSQKEITFSHMWAIPGTYMIKVKCRDELGGESEWSSLNISILPDTIPPEIEIKSPKQGYLYIFNKEIGKTCLNKTIIIGKKSIYVIARDNLFVTKVEFYIDDRFKYSDDDTPYLWTWDEPAFGKHSIKVMAYDQADNIGNAEITVWAFI